MAYGRYEVGERLAGARAGLDGQVLPRVDGVRHRLGHLHLSGAFGAADAGHRRGEEGGDVGQVGRVIGVEEVVGHGTKRYR